MNVTCASSSPLKCVASPHCVNMYLFQVSSIPPILSVSAAAPCFDLWLFTLTLPLPYPCRICLPVPLNACMQTCFSRHWFWTQRLCLSYLYCDVLSRNYNLLNRSNWLSVWGYLVCIFTWSQKLIWFLMPPNRAFGVFSCLFSLGIFQLDSSVLIICVLFPTFVFCLYLGPVIQKFVTLNPREQVWF